MPNPIMLNSRHSSPIAHPTCSGNTEGGSHTQPISQRRVGRNLPDGFLNISVGPKSRNLSFSVVSGCGIPRSYCVSLEGVDRFIACQQGAETRARRAAGQLSESREQYGSCLVLSP